MLLDRVRAESGLLCGVADAFLSKATSNRSYTDGSQLVGNSLGQVRCLPQGHLDTSAMRSRGDRTSNLLVTRQPALPPEPLPLDPHLSLWRRVMVRLTEEPHFLLESKQEPPEVCCFRCHIIYSYIYS